jgi:3-oxoacyl-[acyl-carrier protein] reductase
MVFLLKRATTYREQQWRFHMTLQGKTAFVTGGSRGLGAAIAKRLAHEGAAVAITYTSAPDKAEDVVAAIKSAGGKALTLKADAADAAAIKTALDRAAREFDGIDILVNNAGIAIFAPFDQFSLDDFDRIHAVNVRGIFVAVQAALPHMGEGGRIINIGSINSDSVPFPNMVAYATSKGAVASMTRGLARELAPRKITVNNVQPGPIDTDMNPSTGPLAETMKSVVALHRYGTADEVASLVVYLAGPESAYITGAGIHVDGGWDA